MSRPPLKNGGINDPITFIKEDAQGSIWIGTYASGINRYDTSTKKITHYEASNGYPDKNCWAAFKSNDGVLWLSSTDQGGFLYRVDLGTKGIKNIASILESTLCIYEDDQNNLWASGFNNGLLRFDKNRNLIHEFKFNATDSIDPGINSILQTASDTLLLCTNNGIVIFNKKLKHFSWLRYKEIPDSTSRIFSGYTRNLIKDKTGFIWISTNNGLFKYNPIDETIQQYLHNTKDTTTILSNNITSVIETSSGNIWASSGDFEVIDAVNSGVLIKGGINRLDKTTGKFIHYLNGSNILTLCADAEGTVWAGTGEQGLYYFDKKNNRFKSFFNSQVEISKEPVSKIVEDDLKNLWIVTNSHIVRINPNRKDYFIYGKTYGILPTTLRRAICKTKSGEILVGNNNGFYVLAPKELNEQSKPLRLVVTGFMVNNHEVLSGTKSVLNKPIENIKQISLAYNQNNFTFNFAAIDYRAPETTKYYTLLENYDSIWRDAAGDKSANYLNVPPGDYVFHVKAINIDGVEAEKAIQITITPPWWKTWWAYTIYFLLLLVAIFLTHKFQQQRTIRIERQKAQVKELAQAKEIEKAYTELKSTQAQLIQSEKMASLGELTAGIAHEIQNPLNFVNNFSELNNELISELVDEVGKGNYDEVKVIAFSLKDNEEKINHHGKRADAIVKNMLQHSKQARGVKEPTDINALCDEYLRLAYHGFRAKDKNFNAEIKTDFDESTGKINIVPQDIGRVLLNLFNNAFYALNERKKAADEVYQPILSAQTKKRNDKVEIIIRDNGYGVDKKIVDKIFQPFFTTKPTGQGTGLGLSLSYDIIKAHGGEIKVETQDGEGSEFKIELPANTAQ